MDARAQQEAERIARWAERKTAVNPVASVRPQGAAGHLSPEEKTAIRLAYLETGGTITFKALAAQFGVNRDTVSACMKGPEFEALRKQLEAEVRQTAIAKLKALTIPAVDAWGEAIPIAAAKGDHRPARELLQHTGIVETGKDVSGGVLVLTQVQVNGARAMRGSDGVVYSRDPDTGELCDESGRRCAADLIVQIGCDPADARINLGTAGPLYRNGETGALVTADEARELSESRPVATIAGIQLGGMGGGYSRP